MKLSMWILAGWFSPYIFRADIIEGAANISGVRLFSEKVSKLESDYIYAGKGELFFADKAYKKTVVLAHGSDLLFIKDKNIEDVLNEILSAFDFYNAWETSLWAAAPFDDTVQRMVDLCDGVMKAPLAIAKSSGHIVAYTKGDGPHKNDKGWQQFFETGIVPQAYTSSQIRDLQGNPLSDWSSSPQIYLMENITCLGAQIVVEGEQVAAFYMQEFDQKFTPADIQLAEVFCNILASLASRSDTRAEIKTGTAILSALFDGEEPDPQSFTTLSRLIAAKPPFQLILIQSATASVNIVRKSSLLETIKRTGIRNLATFYGNDVICIVPHKESENFIKILSTQVNMAHYSLGISLPFKSWANALSRYKQALFALKQGKGEPGLFFCQDYSLERLILSIEKANKELQLLHPALGVLLDYDKNRGTQFFATLKRYLTNERNMVKTAEELNLHRNSMKYRMNRIRDLTGLDLDDPKERMYLLLSFYLSRL